MKTILLVTAALSIAACKDKDKDAAAPTGPSAPGDKAAPSGGDGGDCATYAALLMKCSGGAGDKAGLEMTCKATIKSNNAMAASMKAQVACAKSNDACDAYAKCLAGQ